MVITGLVCTALNALILVTRPYVRRITSTDMMIGAVSAAGPAPTATE